MSNRSLWVMLDGRIVPRVYAAGQASGGNLLSATPIGVTTGNEPGSPASGLNIFGYDAQGRPLDASGNVLPSRLPQAIPMPMSASSTTVLGMTPTTLGLVALGLAAAYVLLKD